MNKKSSKPKFIPPISTAASFLRSISKSPEPISFPKKRASALKEFIPEFPREMNLLKFTENSTHFSPRASYITRDISHLKDNTKSFKSSQNALNPFQILPTTVDHLKLLVDANECHSRTSSRGGHLCHKEKCLEDFLDRSSDQIDFKLSKSPEDSLRPALLGSTTGKQDVYNLKEWFNQMKEKYLKSISKQLEISEDRKKKLENFEVIIKTGMKEIIRQISIHSTERGEVLSELVDYSNKYFKLKNSQIVAELRAKVTDLENKNKEISAEKEKITKENSNTIKQLSSELESKKSTLVMKEVEIERLNDHIKRLKAEKVYRIKKELETYNQMLKTFKERENFKEDPSLKIDELKAKKKMQEANESINQIILAKMKLVQKSKKNDEIPHDSIEDQFKDKEIQANILQITSDVATQLKVDLVDAEIETDELVDFVTIQNESFCKSGSFIELPEDKKTRVFKYRLKMEKSSQTDGKLLIETMKKEEEDLINWMVKDRKDYLKTIQKQILIQKVELSKFKGKIAQNRVNLGDSLNVDVKSGSEVSSNCGIDDQAIDGEIESLRKLGIIGDEIEIDSWKNGYYFGFDKGRIEGFGEGEKLGFEKADFDKDLQLSFNSPEIELKVPRKSLRKSTVAPEDFKKGRKVTKFQEFHFQRKNMKSETVVSENKRSILDSFLNEPLANIVKSSKMSKKLVLKTISSIYVSAIGKKNLGIVELADFTYDEIFSKYSQKIMVGKKYLEFVAALLKYPDSRRVITFVKLFGIGKKLGLDDYIRPKESFTFMISLLEKISKSSLGIIIDVDETSDYQFIPTIRAIECTREAIAPYIDQSKLQSIFDFINSKSLSDPKKINKSGIINQEILLDHLLDEVNSFYKHYLDHIYELFKAVTLNKAPKKIHKKDLVALIKSVNSAKFESIVGNSDPVELLTRFCKSSYEDLYEDFDKAQDLCLHFGFLGLNESFAGIIDDVSVDEVRKVVGIEVEENQQVINEFFEKGRNLGLSEDYLRMIDDRINEFASFDSCKPRYIMVGWKVLINEIKSLVLKEKD